MNPVVRDAWRYLLEAWKYADNETRRDWRDLKREIDREGWGAAAIRRFTAIHCPYLKAGPATMAGPTPPKEATKLDLYELVKLEIECPVPPDGINFADECLERVIHGLRKNIELAVKLYEEVNDVNRL